MAEGLARTMAPDGWDIYSAGSAPAGVNPFAIKAMAAIGIDISHHTSDAIDDIPKEKIDAVVTLCAEEVCPVFPAKVVTHHWPHPDPAAVTGGDDEILASFCEVRDQIKEKLGEFFAGWQS